MNNRESLVSVHIHSVSFLHDLRHAGMSRSKSDGSPKKPLAVIRTTDHGVFHLFGDSRTREVELDKVVLEFQRRYHPVPVQYHQARMALNGLK